MYVYGMRNDNGEAATTTTLPIPGAMDGGSRRRCISSPRYVYFYYFLLYIFTIIVHGVFPHQNSYISGRDLRCDTSQVSNKIFFLFFTILNDFLHLDYVYRRTMTNGDHCDTPK